MNGAKGLQKITPAFQGGGLPVPLLPLGSPLPSQLGREQWDVVIQTGHGSSGLLVFC